MKIVMIGAGNVATNIAKTLANIGETPVQIWSRTLASAETLANAVGTCATSDWDSVVKDADVYIVAVKDDAMLNVIDLLCAHCKHGVFVHTAGTMSMSMFTGKAEHYGVLIRCRHSRSKKRWTSGQFRVSLRLPTNILWT